MLRVISHKVAQLFPERYPGEHQELRDEYARDEYESQMYDRHNVYYIRETLADGTERTSDDGYTSPGEAKQIALSGLQDSIDEGVEEIDIIHRDDGWLETVWSREEQAMPKPMMSVPFLR